MTMDDHVKAALVLCVASIMVLGGTIAFVLLNDREYSLSTDGSLARFASYGELEQFVDQTRSDDDYSQYALDESAARSPALLDGSSSYSTTNVQVVGVDEADIVKTDGEMIYAVSDNTVTVIAAHPAEDMEKVATINKTDILGFENDDARLCVSGMYVWSGKLIVVSNVYEYLEIDGLLDYWLLSQRVNLQRSLVSVFDVTMPSSPQLEFTIGISGWHLTSRMIDGVVYLVAQWGVYEVSGDITIPQVWVEDSRETLRIDQVYYDGETQGTDAFVNLMAIDASNGEHKELSVMTGFASTVYMSQDSLYLTYQKWVGTILWIDGEVGTEDEDSTRTTIHKVAVDGLSMEPVATGNVKGWLLDQFSMDEKDGLLRVATTTSWASLENNVYVLGPDMSLMGSLEGLAPTERIYASRFIGDTLYLVTFRQIDPLFVIDLKDPTSPVVVGELKIPGFSSYLHQVGEGLLLGIGSQDGRVKLSLFDVSDPTAPTEMDNYVLDSYSRTEATWDHKAVLYDPVRSMLVIPIYSYNYTVDYSYSSSAWVFNVSGETGLTLWGKISHDADDYNNVRRSLYIDDTLYTVADTTIVASSLTDLSELGTLTYITHDYDEWYGILRG